MPPHKNRRSSKSLARKTKRRNNTILIILNVVIALLLLFVDTLGKEFTISRSVTTYYILTSLSFVFAIFWIIRQKLKYSILSAVMILLTVTGWSNDLMSFFINKDQQRTKEIQIEYSKSRLKPEDGYVRVSKIHPRYFETKDGEAWIPVELNYLMVENETAEQGIEKFKRFCKVFSENGGTSVRIWNPPFSFLEIEDSIGEYNQNHLKNFANFVEIANSYSIKIKFCLEVTRTFNRKKHVFYRKHYSIENGGPFKSFGEYIDSKEGRSYYLSRAKAYAKQFRNSKTVYDWELWNEMDAISDGDWFSFTKVVLDSMKIIFPNQLSSQSLGSFSSKVSKANYSKYLTLINNDIFCVHRYIDPGAEDISTLKPIDESLAYAVGFIRNSNVIRPVFVNECGAVEANHTGESWMNEIDTKGIMLHDMLFAPFFNGAAGPGNAWYYWSYVSKHNLWYHYKRFTTAIKGLNPIQEHFEPFKLKVDNVKFYGLNGNKTTVIWCRDQNSDYKTELEKQIVPGVRQGIKVKLNQIPNQGQFKSAMVYDPWSDKWTKAIISDNQIVLPNFYRSIVVKLTR